MNRVWNPSLFKDSNVQGCMPSLERELEAMDAKATLGSRLIRLQAAVTDDLTNCVSYEAGELISGQAEQLLSVRCAWLIDTLHELNRAGSVPSRRRMFAFWLTLAFWEQRFDVREAILEGIELSAEFVAELGLLVSAFSFQIAVADDAPLNEKELLAEILAATKVSNWPVLMEKARTLRLVETQPWRRQAIRALHKHAPSTLAEVLRNSADWIHAAVTLSSLTHTEAFDIATKARFECVYFAALVSVGSGDEVDSVSFHLNLTAMMKELSLDQRAWTSILEGFNQYPVRYPWLQRPLGAALASTCPERVLDFTRSLRVSTSEGCARELDICLAEFGEHAPLALRRILWQQAYEIWSSWNFKEPGQTALTKPAYSTLDYAVVGWLKEGCTELFVASEIEIIEQKINAIEYDWHESITDFKSTLNALLSRYQLFAHTRDLVGTNWTARGEMKMPRSLLGAYAELRYLHES